MKAYPVLQVIHPIKVNSSQDPHGVGHCSHFSVEEFHKYPVLQPQSNELTGEAFYIHVVHSPL